MSARESSLPTPWIAAGVLVWALHFTMVYGFTALACARGFGAAAPWVIGVATAAGVVATLLIIFLRRSADFTGWMTAAIAAFALLAIVWEGTAAMLVKPCA